MPYRINQRGSLVVDRRYRELGRIRRASGIHNKAMLTKLHTMMDNLYENGRLDVLRDIKSGVVRPLEVYEHWRTQQIEQVPSVATLKPIVPAIPDWIEKHEVSDKTKKGYREHFRAFQKVISAETKILDLPLAVGRYRNHCLEHGTHRAFNLTRSIIQAFLSRSFGRHHSLWQSVSHIQTLKTEQKRRSRVVTPREFQDVLDGLHEIADEHGMMAHSMIVTGMNWAEYASGDWEVLADRVVIHGTKREGRDRVVPLLDSLVTKPERAYKAFRLALRKAGDMSPHDLRRSFSHWMEMAQIPRTRRRLYLGHGSADVTDRYEKHELTGYLVKDAEAIRAYIEVSTTASDEEPAMPDFVESGL